MSTKRVPLLSLRGLKVSFTTPHAAVEAVRGVDLAVYPGECLGVVGASGAGKSQLFLAVMGLLAANARVQGSARFKARELLGLAPSALDEVRGGALTMVFQEPRASLTPHRTIGAQIAEVRVRHCGDSWAQARRAAHALLERVQVGDAARRMRQYPHELSGGMCQRALIAIALASEPQLLIADEPTSSLDLTVQAQILALLAQLKRETQLALVLITHELGAVAGLAERVVVMQHGGIIDSGPVEALLAAPRTSYVRSLIGVMQSSPESPAREMGRELLSVRELTVHLPLSRPRWSGPRSLAALTGVSLELCAGESLAVVGESGSGKSTLVRAALALLPPSAGRILWLGRPLEEFTVQGLRRERKHLQVIFQEPAGSLDPRLNVAELIEEGLKLHAPHLDAPARRAAVCAALVRVGLEERLLMRYAHELSGGQCQRVAIARALILQPQVLLCDEPLSALDVPTQQQILTLLATLRREAHLTLLFVSHNLAAVHALCERVLVLYLGRRMELASSLALRTNPRHPYTRELLAAEPLTEPARQRARLAQVRPGEMPSALEPPSGCVYRTRCVHALALCAAQVPQWEEVAPGHHVACHRWRELPASAAQDPTR